MFSELEDQMEVEEIFETFKEPLEKTPKIDIIIEHYLSLVSQLKKDLNLLRQDLTHHKKMSDDLLDPLEEYQTIQKLSALVNPNVEIDQIVAALDGATKKVIGYKGSEVFLQEEENLTAVGSKVRRDFQLIIDCAKEEGIINWLWEQGHPMVVPLSDFIVYDKLKKKKGNVIIVPLLEGTRGIGVYILLTDKDKSTFSMRDLELINIYARQTALAIQHYRMRQMLECRKEQLSQFKSRLMQLSRLATIGELSAGIAHEINNPLQIIMGNVQMARMGHRPEESLEIIEKQSGRIANIVRGLLTMTRPKQESSFEYLEVNPLIVNTMNLVRGQIEKRNIKVNLDLQKNLPVIQCGSIYFQQILLNFILHAKTQIGQNGSMDICSKSEGKETLVIEVRDSGVPVPPEYIANVMDPFKSLENAAEVNLGLTVSVQMVQDLGGEVTISYNKKTGNVITMRIPSYISTQKSEQKKVASLG